MAHLSLAKIIESAAEWKIMYQHGEITELRERRHGI